MIALPPAVRVELACGVTEMGKGLVGLARRVQQGLAAAPFTGALHGFGGRRAGLIKRVWHDGIGLRRLTQTLEHGPLVWALGHRDRPACRVPGAIDRTARWRRMACPAGAAQTRAGGRITSG